MDLNQMIQFAKQLTGKLNANENMASNDPRKVAYLRNLQREMKKKDVLNIPFEKLTVVVFDMETTGFFPYKGDRILSIGAVRMKGEQIIQDDEFYSLVFSEGTLSEEIEALTGITADQLQKAEPIQTVLRDFYQFVKSDTLVAHHSSHEKKFMEQATWNTMKTTFQHRLIDTAFLTKIAEPTSNLLTLDECCAHYGIQIEKRHHALHDAKATAELWAESIRSIKELGFADLSDVYRHIANM